MAYKVYTFEEGVKVVAKNILYLYTNDKECTIAELRQHLKDQQLFFDFKELRFAISSIMSQSTALILTHDRVKVTSAIELGNIKNGKTKITNTASFFFKKESTLD